MNFLEYIDFSLICFSDFLSLLNTIQFHELSSSLFDHLKYSFLFNFFSFSESDSPQVEIKFLISLSETFAFYSEIYQENQELNILLETYSSCVYPFEIYASNNQKTHFTQTSKILLKNIL
jgi:hypothetical protein